MSALTTKVNSPKVIRVIGNVRNNKIGLTTALTTPSIIPTRSAVPKFSTVTPGRRYEVTNTAIPLMRMFIKISIVAFERSENFI